MKFLKKLCWWKDQFEYIEPEYVEQPQTERQKHKEKYDKEFEIANVWLNKCSHVIDFPTPELTWINPFLDKMSDDDRISLGHNEVRMFYYAHEDFTVTPLYGVHGSLIILMQESAKDLPHDPGHMSIVFSDGTLFNKYR